MGHLTKNRAIKRKLVRFHNFILLAIPESENNDTARCNVLKRQRKFEIKKIDRSNLFEGLPFVQFEAFARRD